MTATPSTSEQLFDDYGEKLQVILSHIRERKVSKLKICTFLRKSVELANKLVALYSTALTRVCGYLRLEQ